MIDPEEFEILQHRNSMLAASLENLSNTLSEMIVYNTMLINSIADVIEKQEFMDEVKVPGKRQVSKIIDDLKKTVRMIGEIQRSKAMEFVAEAGYVVPDFIDSLTEEILETLPTMGNGDIVPCEGCGGDRRVQCGTDMENGSKSNAVMFYRCEEPCKKLYICGCRGRSIMNYKPEEV